MTRFKFHVLLLCAALSAVPAAASSNLRNICTYSTRDYSYGGTSSVFEYAGVYKMTKKLSLLGRYYYDSRENWNNKIITGGIVWVFDKHNYSEFSYGYGKDSNDVRSDYYNVDFTNEKKDGLYGASYRYTSQPGYGFHTVSPYCKYYFSRPFTVFGRVYLTYDSNKDATYAYWAEAEYVLFYNLSVKAGLTGGDRMFQYEYDQYTGRFNSWLAGINLILMDFVSFRYQYEALDRSSYSEKINTLNFDFRFR
ncbi:MAG: hypothetical protein JW803_07880 [Endomicrobiales bacterium]|nr:hypothetical protein [Endomicrobiales bacterium]